MSILRIENKFKTIENREKKVKSFYNIFTSKGYKHYCIKDLKKDYEYDTLLFGFGNFYKELPEKPSETVLKSQSPDNRIENSNSPASNSKLTHLDKNICEYKGNFSNTRFSMRTKTSEESNNMKLTPKWKASAQDERKTLKSSFDVVITEDRSPTAQPINLFKKIPKLKDQADPKEFLLEKNYVEKTSEKFDINVQKKSFDKDKFLKKPWFDIRYSKSPYYKADAKGEIKVVCLDDDGRYPEIRFFAEKNEKVFLPRIKWLESWEAKVVRIQINGEKNIDFFLCLSDFSDDLAKKNEKKIDEYFLMHMPKHGKNSVSPVMPLTLKLISEKSPIRSRTSIKLPDITTKAAEKKEKKYHNPLTQRLVTYRDNISQFNPVSFPSILTVFETEDFIEARYKKGPRKQKSQIKDIFCMEIEGKKVKK